MDYWLSYIDEDPDQTLEVARAAERAGFRGIALADHVCVPLRYRSQHPSGGPTPFDHRTPFPDPLVTAASVLASTQGLLAMSYVYVLPMREPFSVASQVGTLDRLSGSRFRFGVGAGWLEEEIALLGHPVRDRGRRMDEMLEIIRAFWARDSVDHHGKHFDFDAAGIAPRPRQAVPIWVVENIPDANLFGLADQWDLASKSGQELRVVIFGLLLVVMMIIRPQGLAPSARREVELKDLPEEERIEEPAEIGGYEEGALGAPPSSPLESPMESPGRPGERSQPGE